MTVLLWAIGCFAFLLMLWLAMSKSKWREELGDTGDLDPVRRIGKHPALGAGYRDGPTLRFDPDTPRDLDEPWRRAEHNLQEHPPKETTHPRPRYLNQREAAERRARNHMHEKWPTKQIILTPRHLEHINIRRRQNGRPPVNAAGFRAAIAEQALTGTKLINSPTDEWLAYLIAFELLHPEHQSHRVAVDTTIAIEPDKPFNGQYGGAGATGSFDPPGDLYVDFTKAATGGFAAALGAGAALSGTLIEPCSLHDGSLPPPDGAAYPGNAPPDDAQPQADPEPAPQAGPPAGDND